MTYYKSSAQTLLYMIMIMILSSVIMATLHVRASSTTSETSAGVSIATSDFIKYIEPGGLAEFNINITNCGEHEDAFKLSWLPVSELHGATVALSTEFTEIIAPEEATTVTLYVHTATNVSINDFIQIEVTVSSQSDPEVIEKIVFTVVFIHKMTDLAIYPIDITLSKMQPIDNEPVYINVTIRNLGGKPADNVEIVFIVFSKADTELYTHAVNIDTLACESVAYASALWTANIAANTIVVIADPTNTIPETNETNNRARVSISVAPRTTSGSHLTSPLVPERRNGEGNGWMMSVTTTISMIVISALVGVGITLTAVLLNSEHGRFAFFKFIAPLYTKVRRDELLNHNTREAVYAYVNSHPGDHYRSILNNLGLTNGTLTYHLATLEREEFIRSERDGPLKRFYPADTEFAPGMALELTPIQKSIYDLISKSPGISQKEIAAKIGVSAPTVNYHIKAMVNARLVRLERHRKVTRCFIVESSSC